MPCDVEDIASVDAVFAAIGEAVGQRSISCVHAIAYSDKNELKGRYADTTRENFCRTMVISCFSFTEVARRAARTDAERRRDADADLQWRRTRHAELQRHGGSQGGARSLGALSRGRFRARGIRVNAISAGPMRTLAGAGIGDARAMFAFQQKHSPLGRGVTLEDLGGAALYLLSDLSAGVTGEIHFVDSGYNMIAMPHPDALKGERKTAAGSPRRRQGRACPGHPRLPLQCKGGWG